MWQEGHKNVEGCDGMDRQERMKKARGNDGGEDSNKKKGIMDGSMRRGGRCIRTLQGRDYLCKVVHCWRTLSDNLTPESRLCES